MTFDVETKDCTALSDGELADMADIVADGPAGLDIGLLSKQRDEWVLVTQVRDEGRLLGFSFCTLERIGGTPCVLWGLVSVKRCAEREAVLDALRADQFRKAVLAFPDEDVLVEMCIRDRAKGLEGLRRQDGIHAAAVVISNDPLTEHLPVQRKPEPGGRAEDCLLYTSRCV